MFLSVAQCCLLKSFTALGVDGQGIGCLDLVGARQSTLNICPILALLPSMLLCGVGEAVLVACFYDTSPFGGQEDGVGARVGCMGSIWGASTIEYSVLMQ